MSELILRDCLKPVSQVEIRAFEQWIGFAIPAAYRDFLLQWNGGYANRNLGKTIYMKAFYGLSSRETDRQFSLRNANGSNGKFGHLDIPRHFLKIGVCDGTDAIWMNLLTGKIYARDGQIAYDDPKPPIDEQFREEAGSFADFLWSLRGDLQFSYPDDERICIGRWADAPRLGEFLARGGDINSVNEDGNSIVGAAIEKGEIEFVDECVKRGAVLNRRGLLHRAAFARAGRSIEYLLRKGADPNELHDNRTPLDCTMNSRDWEHVRELLEQSGGRYSAQPSHHRSIPGI